VSRPRGGGHSRRLDLLYEDRSLIVVNKPAGLLTIPTAPGRAEHEDTLLGRARDYARHKRGRQAYVGMLHRLDRGTSGALAIALEPTVHAAGRDLFRHHAFDRTYLALVHGAPASDRFTIDRAISSDYRDGRRVAVDEQDFEDALHARTHVEVLERFGTRAALLRVTLETGRQHQIRIHLSGIGHPLIGDRVYGRERASAKPGDRPMLHAWTLGFAHPLTGAHIEVTAPVPADLRRTIDRLSHQSPRGPHP
jgi:23S rRNA pseudouridine1911/1915/1917 synthase